MTTLAFGLAGGFIVLRGFAKTKESSEQILAAYEGMLKQPTKNKKPQEPKTAT